ncbi:MAG: alpha/beta hydrolase [Lachnospiraceae bacterium]|nr:alpha/beta hydrolase [Lachnospiraceae bacterium]
MKTLDSLLAAGDLTADKNKLCVRSDFMYEPCHFLRCFIKIPPDPLIQQTKQPAVSAGYFNEVITDASCELKYTQMGTYEVSTFEQASDSKKIGRFRVWYPAELETSGRKYPVVVMVNGSGTPASKYEAIFDHLASWGFIVAGNEDGSSGTGESAASTLDFILGLNEDADSLFYGKIDTQNIGIAGHSQGGSGTINAVTAYENGNMCKVMYTASTPTAAIASDVLKAPYDVSGIQIPWFMTAGTGEADSGNEKNTGISPLWSNQENCNTVTDDVMKVLARRTDTGHGDMLPYADGYMTAWFMYHLQGDETADTVFLGDNAEILNNANWQDVQKNR